MSNKDPIFKEDDKVYHWKFGWGIVSRFDCFDELRIIIKQGSTIRIILYNQALRTLSFTEYDFVNGGLSHKRPLPSINLLFLNKKWKYLEVRNNNAYLYDDIPGSEWKIVDRDLLIFDELKDGFYRIEH